MGDSSWEGGGTLSKIVINLPRTYEKLHSDSVLLEELTFSRGDFSPVGVDIHPSPKKVIKLTRSYYDSVVSEILRYTHTHTQTDRQITCYFYVRMIL